jgi:hypothetical protein
MEPREGNTARERDRGRGKRAPPPQVPVTFVSTAPLSARGKVGEADAGIVHTSDIASNSGVRRLDPG